MRENLQITLAQIAERLNSANVLWGVGASVLLHQYSLVDQPSDIDILVTIRDIAKVDEILSTLGDKKTIEPSNIYATECFCEYTINEVNIDVIAGFNIVLPQGLYTYTFDHQSVPNQFDIDGITTPFMSIEDWYILYQLIPNREYKVDIIETFFKKNGIEYPSLLYKQLENSTLPDLVKSKTKALLASYS